MRVGLRRRCVLAGGPLRERARGTFKTEIGAHHFVEVVAVAPYQGRMRGPIYPKFAAVLGLVTLTGCAAGVDPGPSPESSRTGRPTTTLSETDNNIESVRQVANRVGGREDNVNLEFYRDLSAFVYRNLAGHQMLEQWLIDDTGDALIGDEANLHVGTFGWIVSRNADMQLVLMHDDATEAEVAVIKRRCDLRPLVRCEGGDGAEEASFTIST